MSDTKYKILVIDDDRTVCNSLKLLLGKSGYEVMTVSQPTLALETVREYRPDLVLLDMNFSINTSGKQGLQMLRRLLEQDESLIVILITGWATLQLAVEGMKLGARDFLAKPWENKHLLSSISSAIELYSAGDRSVTHGETSSQIIGSSAALREVISLADRVSRTDASVLITGDSGTGKEVIAEYIHQHSRRSDAPFVKVNLGGVSTSLFESEMFGHKRGAYTDASSDREGRFARAERGTIFLDEIGDLALESQVKLLRVLQEKTYEVLGSSQTISSDVRVISATHRDVESMIGEGTFREDLYYRINLIRIHIPSLAERTEDIPDLVRHFAQKVGALYELDVPIIMSDTMDWLSRQTYSGNIRQLRNLVERTVLLAADQKELRIKDFQKNMLNDRRPDTMTRLPEIGEITLDELEKRMIIKALDYHDRSISATARSLGITRSSLYRRMEKYGVG